MSAPPSVLSIAGLDPSGGAGLAADLRAFQAAGAWGCAVCACLTVQSTQGLRQVHPVTSALLEAQVVELLGDLPLRVWKTGALGSPENAQAVVRLASGHPELGLVVDPVMMPSRSLGAARLDGDPAKAQEATGALASIATLLTPNLVEGARLLGRRETLKDTEARDAAVGLLDLGCRAVLLKGGHAEGAEVVDWLALRGGRVLALRGPRLSLGEVHGTGCTLASLIAGRLAWASSPSSEEALVEAVHWARERLQAALRNPLRVGKGMQVTSVQGPPSSCQLG